MQPSHDTAPPKHSGSGTEEQVPGDLEVELSEPIQNEDASGYESMSPELGVNRSTVEFNPGAIATNSSVPETFSLPLSWHDLSYRVGDLQILQGLTGTALGGRCLAIMGSSGAGKTTFLNAISDRLAEGGACELTGRRQLGDAEYTRPFRKAMGFVTQDDILLSMDTPYDALWFALRTRRGTTRAETHTHVMEMLETLRISHCKDTIVGVPGVRAGLSGGERKRTSIGVELICDPKILLLDEPTSGLDSVTAVKIVQLLRELARTGRTIIYTIHQPTAEVLSFFDDLMLLTGGRCVYHGPMAQSLTYFASIGYTCPEYYTAGDYFLTLLQDEATAAILVERWETHLKTHRRTPHTTAIRLAPARSQSSAARFLTAYIKKFASYKYLQLSEVFVRRFNQLRRDRLYLISLCTQELFFAIVVGLIFIRLTGDVEGIIDREGLLYMVVVNRGFSSTFLTLSMLHQVRAVFIREQAAGAYPPYIYFIAMMAAQFPSMLVFFLLECVIVYFLTGLYTSAGAFFLYCAILVVVQEVGVGIGFFLSAVFSSLVVAGAFAPLMLVPLSAAGGLMASTERLRPYWYWLEKPSFFRHGYILLMRNEFDHLSHFSCNVAKYGETYCRNQPTSGEAVLRDVGFNGDRQSKSGYMWLSLVILWILFRVLCVIALTILGRQKG